MSQSATYFTYLARLWQTTIQTEPVWQATLEDPHSGARTVFADLNSLCFFMEELVARHVRQMRDNPAPALM